MFAIIEEGSKQYSVEEGTIIDIEKIQDPAKKTIIFDKVLLFSDNKKTTIGQPFINGASVNGKVLENFKDDKIIVFKFKRKTGYKLTQGHRQNLTRVKIEKLNLKTTSTNEKATEKAPEDKLEKAKVSAKPKSKTKTEAKKAPTKKTETKAKTTKPKAAKAKPTAKKG